MRWKTKKEIEAIGEAILADYAMIYRYGFSIPLDVERFARQYLGMDTAYRKLSENGSILGLTAYQGVTVVLPLHGAEKEISVSDDAIFLDESLKNPCKEAQMRFTAAHECAHQILARIEEQQTGYSFRKAFEPGTSYLYGAFKTAEEWSEWQANALAAVLLMPKHALAAHLTLRQEVKQLTLYGDSFNSIDSEKVRQICKALKVSRIALKIRLKDLGFLTVKPKSEFVDPYNVMAG